MNCVPSSVRLTDIARRLPPNLIAGICRARAPGEGDLVLAQVASKGPAGHIDLASGRSAALYGDDLIWAAVGRYEAPLAIGCDLPTGWGEASLVGRSGIAGTVALRAPAAGEPAALRLLGLAVDSQGEAVTLARLGLPLTDAPRPLNTVAVVSCARGSHAGGVATAVVRGFCRMGLRTAVAKPIGVIDAAERWDFIDAGASEALDLVDAGHLSAAGMSGAALYTLSRRMLGRLGATGITAGVLRVAGGLAVCEVEALLGTPGIENLADGVVLTAADALSAIEGARRLRELGLPLIAVSGAITKSPLASREASENLDCPVLSPADLAQPATLQRLLSMTLRRAPVVIPKLRLAA